MQRKLIAVAIANLFVAVPAAWAEPDDFQLHGTVGAGGIDLREDGKDRAKLFEYRDVSGGILSLIDLKGRGKGYYIDFYGENLGRDDMMLDLRGGSYNKFKYQLYSDSLRHNFTFGARTPYSGAGTANQTVGTTYQPTIPPVPPSTTPGGNFFRLTNGGNPALWNSYDLSYKRRNDGGSVEFSFGTPFYVRLDASQLTFDGNKLQAYAQGTSPGNGFVDLATPVDYTTKNLGFEVGYGTKQMQLSLNFLSSKFENENPVLRWTNAYFAGGTDASPLAPDNDYTRWSANAVFKRLPVGSTLAIRYTTSTAENTVNLLSSTLSTGTGTPIAPTNPATNPTRATFAGEINYDTYSIALNSNPSRMVDTKLYLNHFEKENASTKIDWVGLPGGLGCGDAPVVAGPPALSNCNGELFSYEKQNYGLDVGVRFGRDNKLTFGYDVSKLERERKDSTETDEDRYSIEWRNQTLDTLTARAKFQFLDRQSNFVGANQGTGPSDTLFLQRFVARYDVSNLEQTLFKIGVDYSPADNLDLGAEVLLKENKYKDTVLGRTKDDRTEYYLSLSYGDRDVFRITAFWGQEVIKYDSAHRTINAGTCPIIPPATTPSPCFDPFQPATATAFNWAAVNRDTTTSFGLGFDWPTSDRLTLKGSLVWLRSTGDVSVTAQRLPTGAPAANLFGITNYGNNEKFSLTFKGDYRFSKRWELTGGVTYEDVNFNDAQFNNYTYIVPVTAVPTNTTSYLSGWYANPEYTASIAYLILKYKF